MGAGIADDALVGFKEVKEEAVEAQDEEKLNQEYCEAFLTH